MVGRDKGKTGKVIKAIPKEMKVIVEGINVRKVHIRPKKQGEKGQLVPKAMPVSVSNVVLVEAK